MVLFQEETKTEMIVLPHRTIVIIMLSHIAFSCVAASETGLQTYYPPSVLGFYYSAEGPDAKNLWMFIPCSSLDSGNNLNWNPFPAIWHKGKWKFCVWEEDPQYEE